MEIKNLPEYADRYEYVVAREVEGDLWFYGAYANHTKAVQVAVAVDGVVIHTQD